MDYKEALQKAANLCSQAEKCEFEIRAKLSLWELSVVEHDELIDTLRFQNFIDDERYVRAFANEKFNILSWGKLKIRYELQLKKLDSEVIVKVLDEFDDQKYIEKLAILLERKKRTIRARSDTELIQKLFRYAMPRLFWR